MVDKRIKHGEGGGKRTKEYWAWLNMINRCERLHRDYGGRGIQICARWRNNYVDFLTDVGRAPSLKHSLDRIDNNGNYEPGNVRWATARQQRANQRPDAEARRIAVLKSSAHREAQRQRELERRRGLSKDAAPQ